MVARNTRNNYYDFQKITLEELNREQSSNQSGIALTNQTIGGSGVLLDAPTERIIFDSNSLTLAQAGYIATHTFDGRGILAEPVAMSDLSEGVQISVQLTGARINGEINLVATIIGKVFDGSLKYEHLVFSDNSTLVTKNHFKEVTNILFQNMFGNLDTTVDGHPSFNTLGAVIKNGIKYPSGRILITEASSYKVSTDLVSSEWTQQPDMIFRDYKVYFTGLPISTVLAQAIGSANDINELNVNTTAPSTRTFPAGGATDLIYAQKFQMIGNNIQKITLALGLSSGSDWSGTLVVGITPLLTAATNTTEFLPNNEIEFDPDTIPLEEIAVTKADLANRGIVLASKTSLVDFVFTSAQISNPSLSKLIDGGHYAITVRRTGNSATGTLFFDEATNDDSQKRRLSVFSNAQWTDIPGSTMWYSVASDSVKIASGTAFDQGVRLPISKTELGVDGILVQKIVEDINLVDTSEGEENYLILKKNLAFSAPEAHPRTGDEIFSEREDVPNFSFVKQNELETILIGTPATVVLARVKDLNPRSNPQINGTIDFPGLALGNTITIVSPGTDLLEQNVVGSVITPNTLKPQHKYRITSQIVASELFGDLDNNSKIDVFDANRVAALDGYHSYLATTTGHSSTEQKAAVLGRSVSILEILKSNLDTSDGDGYDITNKDLIAINKFINEGTAFPNGQSAFSIVSLTVEPVLNSISSYDADAVSTLRVENIDSDLIDVSNFSHSSSLSFVIDFIPTWNQENVEIVDLRRYVTSTFSDFSISNLEASIETGGENNLFIPGNTYLSGNVLNVDGSYHKLDYERNIIEIELPTGTTQGEINIFEEYIAGKMKFADGTFVSSSALNKNQVKFDVALSSHVKNISNIIDGYVDFDGYSDGYGANADEAIGTYLYHNTGLLRIRAFNIVDNALFPELRTRIVIGIAIKKAGFGNTNVLVQPQELVGKLRIFAPGQIPNPLVP